VTKLIPVTINCNGKLETINLPPKLCLIRHCQSLMNYLSDEANIHQNPELMDIFIGNHHWDCDIQLSKIGIQQGLLLSKFWQNLKYTEKYPTCISSNYIRCCQTASYIKQSYLTNSAFKEKNSGALYARNKTQLNQLVPNYEKLNSDKWNFEGGESESFKLLQKRLYNAFIGLNHGDTVIITHSDVITTIKSMIEGTENQTFNEYLESLSQDQYPQNGEIIEYDFEQGTVAKTRIIYDQLKWKYVRGLSQNLTLAKYYVK
jgi:broad specificity phosphatase PhoE